jgi:serine/threonine kinase PknH
MDDPTQPYWQPPPPPRRAISWPTLGAAAVLAALVVVTVLVTKIVSGPHNTSATTTITPATTPPTSTVTVTPPPGPTLIIPVPPPGPAMIIPVPPPPPDPEVTASNQLSALASDDAGFVSEVLASHWVAQLSSKKPGTIDDGMQYDDQSILNEHLGLRADYNAKLLTKSGYWVTVAPLVFTDQASANNWCTAVGRDTDHCFATRLNINE